MTSGSLQGRMVLVVEPDLGFADALTALLSDDRVVGTRSMEEAATIAEGGRVDLALVGPSFGDEAGVASAAVLREADRGLLTVLVADVPTNRVLRAALRSGFTDVIDAPVSARKLAEVLSRTDALDAARSVSVVFEGAGHAAPAHEHVEMAPMEAAPVAPMEAAPVAPVEAAPVAPVEAAPVPTEVVPEPLAADMPAAEYLVPEAEVLTAAPSYSYASAADATFSDAFGFEPPELPTTPDTAPFPAPETEPAAPETPAPVDAVPEAPADPAPLAGLFAEESGSEVAAPEHMPSAVPVEDAPFAPPPEQHPPEPAAPAVPIAGLMAMFAEPDVSPNHEAAPELPPEDSAAMEATPPDAPPMPSTPPPTAVPPPPITATEAVPLPTETTTAAPTPGMAELETDDPSPVPLRTRRPGGGRVITVMAGKGGSGKTITATNLATALTETIGEDKVAIVDADLQFGDVALMLQVDPTRTILDAVADIDELTEPRLDSILLRHDSGLRLLPAPLVPAGADKIGPKDVIRIVEILRGMYPFVVVDTPPIFDDGLISLLETSDDVLLVVDMDLPSVKNAKIALDTLRAIGFDLGKVRIMVNRANSKARLDLAELERALGEKVAASIPSDRLIPQSVNEGVPAVAFSPRSRVAKAFHTLAEMFLPTVPGR